MPRDGSGVYSAPPGTNGAPNTTIKSDKYNAFVADIVDDANDPRPATAGGTGHALGALPQIDPVTKAAGTYSAGPADSGDFWRFTGAGTINLGAAATLASKWVLWVRANGGTVTIDPDGAETIDGAATLALADGQTALIVCTGATFFTVMQGVAGGSLTVTSTDAGAGAGPDAILDRNSPSPLGTDLLGRLLFRGRDSVNAVFDYASIHAMADNVTNGSEEGSLRFTVTLTGATQEALTLHHSNNGGVQVHSLFEVANFTTNGSAAGVEILSGVESTSATGTGSTKNHRFYNPNGEVGSISTNASATAYTTSSDARKKKDFQHFDAGTIIDKIQVGTFRWIIDDTVGYGVLAQDVQLIFPQAVEHDEQDDTWSVDYSKFVPLLIAEIKALRSRVAALEA